MTTSVAGNTGAQHVHPAWATWGGLPGGGRCEHQGRTRTTSLRASRHRAEFWRGCGAGRVGEDGGDRVPGWQDLRAQALGLGAEGCRWGAPEGK